MKKLQIIELLILVLLLASPAYPATQVSQCGITWTFDGDYDVGQFVNGDYWVVGPVTIVSVAPAWDGQKHGSMVDPIPLNAQGYDSRINMGFSAQARVQFPVTLSGVTSLISTKGLAEVKVGGAAEGLDTAAVLTVVESPVPDGTFRPPYASGNKPFYNVNQLNYAAVPLLPTPSGVTVPGSDATLMKLWLDHGPKVTGATIHPLNNMPPYPRDSAAQVSTVSLIMMLDTPMRETLIHRMIQLGIDLYHVSLQNGDAFRAYGGFGSGRKWPILFAGILLDVPEMKSPPQTISTSSSIKKFGEDGHTYYGQPTATYPEGKPLWGQDCSGSPQPYWGNHDCRDPDGLLEAEQMINGGSYRSCCTSYTWVGQALAARLMGAYETWDWPAFFDYVDRWVKETGNYGNDFVGSMWAAYRDFSEGIVPPPTIDSIQSSLDSIKIRWSHGILEFIEGFTILRGTSPSGPFTQIASGVSGLEYTDSTVSDGVIYYYQIKAEMNGNLSDPSQTVYSYTTSIWGHEDFESATWTDSDVTSINNLEWILEGGSGNASRERTTDLLANLNSNWIRVGLHTASPSFLVTTGTLNTDFTLEFDDFQKYSSGDKGALLFFVDSNNHYRIQIDRSSFNVWRVLNGVKTLVGGSASLAMQHQPSSAHFRIGVRRSGSSTVFTCSKSDWYKYDTQTLVQGPTTLVFTDSDATAFQTLQQGRIGFYQLTSLDDNVPKYDNVKVVLDSDVPPPTPPPTTGPTFTFTPTPTKTPLIPPTVTPTPTITPFPESGIHEENLVFKEKNDSLPITLVVVGQDQTVPYNAFDYKDNTTGILLDAFGETFLTDTVGPNDWFLTNSESQNVILVDDPYPGPINDWMEFGPSRSTLASPAESLFETGISEVGLPIQYGVMSTQPQSGYDLSFYRDKVQLERHVLFVDQKFFVVLDEMSALDGQNHTFGWTAHCQGTLTTSSGTSATFTKASGRSLDIRFLGATVIFENFAIPQVLEGSGNPTNVPYFIAKKTGPGTQYLTVLHPRDLGQNAATYQSLPSPHGLAGKVTLDGADYHLFCQPEPFQQVAIDGRLGATGRLVITKSIGGELQYLFAVDQIDQVLWNGNLVLDQPTRRSYLFQKSEDGAAITTFKY